MEDVSIIGLDIAKNSFQAHGASAAGVVVFRKKLPRGKVLEFLSRQPELGHPGHLDTPIGVCPCLSGLGMSTDIVDMSAICHVRPGHQ